MFKTQQGKGDIWIDTTVMLPLLAEKIQNDESPKRYTQIIKSLTDSGVSLYVTDGVVRELLNHIKLSVLCSKRNSTEWNGRIPYLFFHYIEFGYDRKNFINWVEFFRGNERPEEDISDYLTSNFSIKVKSLENEAKSVNDELRYTIERLWSDAHGDRRNGSTESDIVSDNTDLLIKNDVDSYLGIIALRKNETSTELGYKNWWLTIDSLAWKIRGLIKTELNERAPASPLMSLDFLSNNFSFGLIRSKLDRTHEQVLPIFLEIDMDEYMPQELLDVADNVRKQHCELPEYMIRRKVRDACDKSKRKFGLLTKKAVSDV